MYDVIIIGSGVAGLSAAIYTGRQGNETLVLRGDEPGGQLTLTSEVANYPGFDDAIHGQSLISQMESQAKKFGSKIENGIVTDVTKVDNTFEVYLKNKSAVQSKSVIVASGASARTLGVEGEDSLMGYGVSTCATCDGAFYRGDEIAIVGGGDAASEEAVFLTKFAEKVHMIHRRDSLRAEQYWTEKVQEKVESGEIEIHWNTEVSKIHGEQDVGVDKITVQSHSDGHPLEKDDAVESTLSIEGLFIAIGHTPNTEFLTETTVSLDETGYILLPDSSTPPETATSVSGLFAAGDVTDDHYQQAATASGDGVKAALDVDDFLERQ